MMKYKFLVKPLFYISALLFSCWMVLEIEKYRPKQQPPGLSVILSDYESGKIDSVELKMRLKEWLGDSGDIYVLRKNE